MGEEGRHRRIVIQIRVPLPTFDAFHFRQKKYQNAAAAFMQVGVPCVREEVEWRNGLLYLIKNSSK